MEDPTSALFEVLDLSFVMKWSIIFYYALLKFITIRINLKL